MVEGRWPAAYLRACVRGTWPTRAKVLPGAAEIAYTSPFSTPFIGASISSIFVTRFLFVFLILTAPLAHAQSAPEVTPALTAAIVADKITATTAAAVAAATSATDTAIASAIHTTTATASTVAAAVVSRIDALEGKVSYFASKFSGRKTASGESFNPNALTMAHKTLPFGTLVRVTNPSNGKSVQVRVNDRGPFVADRVADLSHAAARQLDLLRQGVAHVQLEILGAYD